VLRAMLSRYLQRNAALLNLCKECLNVATLKTPDVLRAPN